MKEKSNNSKGKISTEEKLQNAISELYLQNELKRKLEHTYNLAEIGTWDLDLEEQNLYWSSFVKFLHEVPGNFKSDLDTALEFYKDGWSRKTINEAIEDAIAHGTSFDLELIIITAKGNEKWVRVLGSPVMHNGVCKRIYGSTQDITIRKNTELQLRKSNFSLTERVKEQDCLYEISNLKEHELSIEELLSKAVKLIPPGLQFNEIAEAKIIWKGQAFKTDNFRNSKIKLTESDDRFGKKALQVSVHYVDTGQSIEEVSFLTEEKRLLKAITSQLSQKIDEIIKRDEIKIVEEKLIKSNRLYAFTSAINQMIVKTTDETALYNEACRIAVDIGKFRMAWIGMIDEAKKNVLPLVHAGEDEGYFTKMAPISIADIPEGRGPTGTTLREGRFIVSNDIENDPQMAPWKETTAERGYLSCIAFPLRKFGKAVGAYSLYAPVKNFFDDAEIALLEEAAGDISFALENFDIAARYKVAEDKIIESEEVFRRLFNESADATLLLDDTGFTRCNTSAVSILGYTTKEEIIGRQPWEISPEKQPDKKLSKIKAKAMIAKALKTGYNRFEWLHLKADGTELHVEVMLTPITLKGVQSFYTIWRDITERKKAIKEIQDYKFALDESSLVDISDSNGKIKYANENFRRLSKYSQKELFDQDHRILNSGYHPVELFQNLWATVQAGKIWRNEVRNRAKDGSFFWADTTIVPFLDNNGKPFQFITIRTDITERKKTEVGMKLLSKRLQLATNSAGMGIWDWDIVSDHLVWDEGMYRLYKIDKQQLGSVYEGWASRMHPQDMERITEDMENAIACKKDYNIDFRIVLDDSSVRYIKASAVVERDAEGNALHMIGVNWDITELKEKENELRKSEVFNRSVVNSISTHLAVANDKGNIVSINEAWTSFALQNGKTSMERTGVGSNYFEVCEKAFIDGDEIAGQVLQGMKNVLNKKTEDFYLEYPCHSPSEQRWFGFRIAKFESDEPLILLLHTDLTERILVERERQKITDDLIHRNKDLEQFTYIVSHNLRAPVANIKGLSDILTDESLSKDEAGSFVKDLLSSVNKLDTVIVDLNYILQLKTGVSEARERVVFGELVNGIEESIHSLVRSENVKIVAQFDEVAEMITLKSSLYSIFYNLISNSIKYKRLDVPPVIEIKSSRRKDEIELIFKDNGRGIDLEKNGNQIFGLYKRFHQEIEGKGVGLFIVKTHVEALGGKISIKSEVNKGTEFKIIFANDYTDVN